MADVELHHPTLPATQTITVAPGSVPHYEAAGWLRAAAKAAPKKAAAPKKKAPAKKPAEPVKSKEN